MRSADPMNTSGPSPEESANAKMRECSRNRPRIERTWMVSLRPGMPGRNAQIPRTTSSIGTPTCDAR